MVDVRGDVLLPPHCTTPAAVKANKHEKWVPLRAMKTFISEFVTTHRLKHNFQGFIICFNDSRHFYVRLVKRHPQVKGIDFAVIIKFIDIHKRKRIYVHIFMFGVSAKCSLNALRLPMCEPTLTYDSVAGLGCLMFVVALRPVHGNKRLNTKTRVNIIIAHPKSISNPCICLFSTTIPIFSLIFSLSRLLKWTRVTYDN